MSDRPPRGGSETSIVHRGSADFAESLGDPRHRSQTPPVLAPLPVTVLALMRDAPSRRLPTMHNASFQGASRTQCEAAHLADPLPQGQIVRRLFRQLEELLFRGVVVTSYGFVCLLLVTRERVSRGSQRAHKLWAGKADRLREWWHG